MKKQLLFAGSLALLFLTNCKKDPQSPQPIEQTVQPKGTWSLFSYSGTASGNPFSYTTAQYPCIENNKIIVNADATFSSEYTAQDTCFLYKTQTSALILGYPSNRSTGTWTATDKILSMKYSNSSTSVQGQLSILNGKSYLTFNTTSAQTNSTFALTYVK